MKKFCQNRRWCALLVIFVAATLAACESSECRLAKERQTAARLAFKEAEMKLEGTAVNRKIIISTNKKLEAEGLSHLKRPVPSPVKPYPGQEAREAKLLRAKVFAASNKREAESLRIKVCK